MTARRDSCGAELPFADGPAYRLLAHTQEARRFFRADQSAGEARRRGRPEGGEGFNILWREPAVATGRDGGRPQLPSCYGAKNGRPAYAKAVC
jgi:hypothetical protein